MSKKHLKDNMGIALCGIDIGIRIQRFTTVEFSSFDKTVEELFREDQDYICKRCKNKFIKLNKERINFNNYMNSTF